MSSNPPSTNLFAKLFDVYSGIHVNILLFGRSGAGKVKFDTNWW